MNKIQSRIRPFILLSIFIGLFSSSPNRSFALDEQVLKKAIQSTVNRARSLHSFTQDVADTVLKRALAEPGYYLEFDGIVEEAISLPRENLNTENDNRWLEHYFTHLTNLVLKPDAHRSHLRGEKSFFTFVNMARRAGIQSTYQPTVAQITHDGDPTRNQFLREVTYALTKLEVTDSQEVKDYLPSLIKHGLLVLNYSADGEDPKKLKFLVTTFKTFVREFEKDVTIELMTRIEASRLNIGEELARETYERLLAGSVSEQDITRLDYYSSFGEAAKYSIDAVVAALESNLDQQKKLAVEYYHWKNRSNPAGFISTNDNNTFIVLFKNLDQLFSEAEQVQFVKRYFHSLSHDQKFQPYASLGAEYINSHWPIMRKALEESGSNDSFFYESTRNFILENMDYQGTPDQKTIIETYIKAAHWWKTSTKAVFAKVFPKVNDPVLAERWSRTLAIPLTKNREIFLGNPKSGTCAYWLNRIVPTLAGQLPPVNF